MIFQLMSHVPVNKNKKITKETGSGSGILVREKQREIERDREKVRDFSISVFNTPFSTIASRSDEIVSH